MDEAEQDVLGADVVVIQHLGLFLGQDDDTTGSVRESLEHLNSSPTPGRGVVTFNGNDRGCAMGRCSPWAHAP
jgi:hypothetical protein